jgi:predicted permease
MEFIKPLSPVISVFLLIAAGFIFAQWKKINLASITEIIVYLGTPALVFSALAGKALVAEDIVLLFVGSTLIFAALGLLIGVYFVLSGFHSRGVALPILFMNAGNMGIIGVVCIRSRRNAACDVAVRLHRVPAVLPRHLYPEWARQLDRNFPPAVNLRVDRRRLLQPHAYSHS